jgi:DNA-binding CsgD family transcriptional regulator
MMQEDVLEGLPIGILILSAPGNLVFANGYAEQICRLLQTQSQRLPASSTQFLPQPIWRMYQAVNESRELFPERSVIIEDTIPLNSSMTVQVRARWLELEIDSYILVMLEAQSQAQSITEAQAFKLTDRETEVWLLRRAGYPYKAIAAQLRITLNTVKKHIKNIHAKREIAKWLSESPISK